MNSSPFGTFINLSHFEVQGSRPDNTYLNYYSYSLLSDICKEYGGEKTQILGSFKDVFIK